MIQRCRRKRLYVYIICKLNANVSMLTHSQQRQRRFTCQFRLLLQHFKLLLCVSVFTWISAETARFLHKHPTCSLLPPGTNSWLASWATAVIAGRRSPQADARMSLMVTLIALSVTMVSALLRRYSSSEGDTTSRSSFLRTALSFLLTRRRRSWCHCGSFWVFSY